MNGQYIYIIVFMDVDSWRHSTNIRSQMKMETGSDVSMKQAEVQFSQLHGSQKNLLSAVG